MSKKPRAKIAISRSRLMLALAIGIGIVPAALWPAQEAGRTSALVTTEARAASLVPVTEPAKRSPSAAARKESPTPLEHFRFSYQLKY